MNGVSPVLDARDKVVSAEVEYCLITNGVLM